MHDPPLDRLAERHSGGAPVAAAGRLPGMTVVRSILLFVLAAGAEIAGAWLVWQGVREHRGLLWIGAG